MYCVVLCCVVPCRALTCRVICSYCNASHRDVSYRVACCLYHGICAGTICMSSHVMHVPHAPHMIPVDPCLHLPRHRSSSPFSRRPLRSPQPRRQLRHIRTTRTHTCTYSHSSTRICSTEGYSDTDAVHDTECHSGDESDGDECDRVGWRGGDSECGVYAGCDDTYTDTYTLSRVETDDTCTTAATIQGEESC